MMKLKMNIDWSCFLLFVSRCYHNSVQYRQSYIRLNITFANFPPGHFRTSKNMCLFWKGEIYENLPQNPCNIAISVHIPPSIIKLIDWLVDLSINCLEILPGSEHQQLLCDSSSYTRSTAFKVWCFKFFNF